MKCEQCGSTENIKTVYVGPLCLELSICQKCLTKRLAKEDFEIQKEIKAERRKEDEGRE